MADLSFLLPGQYHAHGGYGLESGLSLSFEGDFSVESSSDEVAISGKMRHGGSGIQYPFHVQLSRCTSAPAQADARISVAGVPELRGRASLVGPTRELLANDLPNQNQLSARIVPLESPRVYEISGILCLGGKLWFPFHFRMVPTEAEAALENVVALPKRIA